MKTELLMQTGFYQLRSLPLARKRCINLYPHISEDSSFSKISLFGTPGVPIFSSTGVLGSSRGCIIAAGIPYYVIGGRFVSVDRNGTITNHGAISGNDDVSMSYNTKTIAIIDPYGDGYFFTVATATLAKIGDTTFLSMGQVRTVNYKKGYFVFTTDSEWFNSSQYDTNNGQTFGALDFDVEDISPDKLVLSFTSHDLLYVIGADTTALFDNIATNAFPFAEIDGGSLEIGCDARLSVKKFDRDFVMIGSGENECPAVWRISRQTVTKISTDAIDYVLGLATEAELERAIIDTYSQDGHPFLVLTIGSNTFSYDDRTSDDAEAHTWHERQSGYTNGVSFRRWRGQHICKAYGKILIGDNESDKIGYLDMETFTEFGDRIERVVVSQPIDAKGSPVFQTEIEMFIEAGVGNADVVDPQWVFSYSDDGRTWGNGIHRSMGKIGEFFKRLVWRRLGRIPAKRVLRWQTDDACKIVIYKWMTDIGQ